MTASWKQLLFQILLMLVSCRHINTKKSAPTPTPMVPKTHLTTDMRSVVLKGEHQAEKIELQNPVNLSLECTWTGNQTKAPNITGCWRKDGIEVQDSCRTVSLENEQYNLRKVFIINSEENLGNYSCLFGNEAKIDFIVAAPHIRDVRDKPIVSYVGDSVVMTCKMEETQPMPTSWNWYKDNGTDKARPHCCHYSADSACVKKSDWKKSWPSGCKNNSPHQLSTTMLNSWIEEQIFAAAAPQRYEITIKKWKTRLQVKNLTQADSGPYYCGAVYAIGTSMSHVELKVITFMEPLKPFISILIEVVILVTAILIYERKRSRKIDEEENGTNADQNNTPPQGEDGGEESSSIRKRNV